jgi:ATP-dependent helicase/nuclease subunit B
MILSKKKYNSVDPEELISQKIEIGKLSSLLIIVPTNRKRRALKRDLILQSGGKVTGKINIETIGTFSQKIYSSLNTAPFQFLSEAASAVLMKKAFNSSALNYFNRYKTEIPSGTLSRIKNIIGEYKRHGISPGHLFSEAEKLKSSEKLKAEDIARIYINYNEECHKSNSGEMGDIYLSILEKSSFEFSSAFTQLYPEADQVIINGFDEFTAPEVEIINRISPDGRPELYVIFDYYEKNPGVFSHLKDCYERFIAKGFHIAGSSGHESENEFRSTLRKDYFRGAAERTKLSFNIKELIALNREKEIDLIAKEIKELLTQGNVEPQRICVAFNLIQNYSPYIRNKFPQYKIPFNLTDRIPLESAGAVTSIISFLEITENDFYYKNIFRSLSSGFITIPDVNLSDLIITASELSIISGYNNWVTAVEDGMKTADNRKYLIYSRALTAVKKLHHILTPIQAQMNVTQFRDTLFNIVETLKVSRNILEFNTESETFIKSLSAFYDMLSELFLLLLKEYGETEKFPLNFYIENIRTAIENTRFNISEKPGYGVQITNLNEIRGLSFDYLFIGGMMDGELPTRYTPEVFFSGSYVREEWKHQVEERYRFYQSLCTWEKGLYLTHPLQEDNKELAVSNFLSELKNHFTITEKTEKDFAGTIFNREELQDYAGSNIDNDEVIKELKEVNAENIKSLLHSYNLRTDPAEESEYNGYILRSLPEDKRGILSNLRNKEFSATQLEKYARCPFQYFLEKILYLDIIEEPSEDMESRELGSMIHKILFRFYTRLKEENIILSDCNDEIFTVAEEIMFAEAEGVISTSGSKSPLNFMEIEKLKGFNGDRKKSILYTFLKAERENNGGYLPYDFEVPFGNIKNEDGRQTEIETFYSGSIKVRGNIDRVDIDERTGKIRVTDYKLGGIKPTSEELEKGISLQLPLYLYAAKQIVENKLKKDFVPAGADIYSLKYQKKNFGRKPIISDKKLSEEKLTEEYERIINISKDSIEMYVDKISHGIFPTSILENKKNKVCSYCNFNSVCRIEE